MASGQAEEDLDARALDRRTLIKRAAAMGAVAWTAPLVVQSLASPAAASTCTNGTPLPASYTNAGSATFTPGPGITSITVTLIGGGGGGGGAFIGSGGGGGGGASQRVTISVEPCTNYTVVVGAGGTSGVDGEASTFASTPVV